jgi:hypothetical protein
LLVTRGEFQLACNFSDRSARIPVTRTQVRIASHPARIENQTVVLEPLAAALLR